MPITNPSVNSLDNWIYNPSSNSIGGGLSASSGGSSPPPSSATFVTWGDGTQVTWGDGTQVTWSDGSSSSPSLDFSQASNSMYIPLLFGYSIL